MDEYQTELPMPYPARQDDMPLLPARMVNEYQYCPRLAYLEWVQGEWADSADTVDGRYRHKRVDTPSGKLPELGSIEDDERFHARSVTLSSDRFGLIARLDLLEGEGATVTPVDYKRGKRPHVPKGAYEPERVQLCVQGLILQEHGYTVEKGILYFAASKERVHVDFDDELLALTRNAIDGLRFIASGGHIPDPLPDSPKCPRCSLVGICLPDEVNYLARQAVNPRRLAVVREEAMPLYVQAYSAKIAKRGETVEISVKDQTVQSVRLADISQVVLMGNIYVTTPTIREMMDREIPISWHSYGGWFVGHTMGTGHKNVEVRTAQYRTSFDERACLRVAKGLVTAKIQNSRTLLRRNWKEDEKPSDLLEGMQSDIRRVGKAEDLQTLLGLEGTAASRYFSGFTNMLSQEMRIDFDFSKRNRRPPTDPVNALLSYAYSLLTRTWTVTLSAVGLDPYRGYYHQPRYGRPALALDLMEPFRPLIADSCVLQAINNGEVRAEDFIHAAGSVALSNDGRKRFIAAYERRLSHEVTHPLFGYRVSYRRLLEIQARLFARYLLGELPEYPNFTTR